MNSFEIKKLSNNQLDLTLKQAVTKEREILTIILEHIVEVDRRKLFLAFAHPSLFDYLTKHIGYSAGSAQRRIDAARLSKEIPEVISKLENGSLNLAQVGLLQKSVRQCQSENKTKVTVEAKKQIVDELSGKSFAQSQVLVSQSLNVTIKEQPKVTHQQNESVRLEVSLTKTQWEKLNQMRELLSSSLPSGTWDQVLEYVSDKVIAQKLPKTKKSTAAAENTTQKMEPETSLKTSKDHDIVSPETTPEPASVSTPTSTSASIPKARIPLTKKIRDQIMGRDQCCQFQDKQAGKICGSKWRLHIDHIQPVWADGANDISNLRVLCTNHNLELYRQQAGINRKN